MQAQVRAWGNSQGIRLPKDILNQAGILLMRYREYLIIYRIM